LEKRAQHTTMVIKTEEERFSDVLDKGIEIFEEMVEEVVRHGGRIIPGSNAFKLYDTFGFPLDLTQLMAREKGLEVDQNGFIQEMERQRERGKESSKFVQEDESAWQDISSGNDSEFVEYDTVSVQSEIRKIRFSGDQVFLLLSRTPFYAESGGQAGDTGEIIGKGYTIQIADTQKRGDRIVHIGFMGEGQFNADPRVEARLNVEKRMSTARNHTATHLLHKALREVIGDHVH
jgi:alanyl-tRNA synthetase